MRVWGTALHEPIQRQHSRRRRPVSRSENHWLPLFLTRLEAGLQESSWLKQVKIDQLKASRAICQELWPFIKELPANIVSVKDKLPEGFDAANKVDGVQVVVAAELAATQFSRVVLEALEEYFALNSEKYSQECIDEGLSWLRLHAKTNTRHALWMRRMLDDIEPIEPKIEQQNVYVPAKNLPATVDDVLTSVFELWRSLETSEIETSEIEHCGNQ